MTEPTIETSKEIDKAITISHGALEITFPDKNDPRIDKRHPYHCKNLIDGKEVNVSSEKMSLIMSIPEKSFKTVKEICDDYKTWLQGSYNDLGLPHEVHDLSRPSFDNLMHKIQSEFGYNLIDHASMGRYRMKNYPKG